MSIIKQGILTPGILPYTMFSSDITAQDPPNLNACPQHVSLALQVF